ncbi:MAG: cupin domain-containing protein [Candidatus Levybacteria bacterium]|nr:cupin domain-containing protein [Candidatus Levybacteria bacterium]
MKIVNLQNLSEVPTSHAGAGLKKVLVSPGEVPNLHQFGRVVFKPGEIAKEHKHDEFSEIMYVESGTGTMRINRKDYKIHKGDCVSVEVGELHEVENNGRDPLILLFFGVYK